MVEIRRIFAIMQTIEFEMPPAPDFSADAPRRKLQICYTQT